MRKGGREGGREREREERADITEDSQHKNTTVVSQVSTYGLLNGI